MYRISLTSGKEYFNNIEIPKDDRNQLYIDRCDFLHNGGSFVEFEGTPEEIAEANRAKVPESISQMKLRKQLILMGISIASIDALIQSLPQPNRDLIYTMWEYAVVFERSNPELIGLAQMLGLTSEQLDEIFINGNQL